MGYDELMTTEERTPIYAYKLRMMVGSGTCVVCHTPLEPSPGRATNYRHLCDEHASTYVVHGYSETRPYPAGALTEHDFAPTEPGSASPSHPLRSSQQ